MNLDDSIQLIRTFLSPDNRLDQVNVNEISLVTILKNTIDNFESKHGVYFQELHLESEPDSYWKFALISLNILKTLNDSSFELNANNCYISVKDEQLLNKLVQLSVCFGIHYNLEDNVGISIEKLSKYGANITKKRYEISSELRNKRLTEFLNILYAIKLNKREHVDIIHGLLYRKHLHDLISALLQAIYSPNSHLVISKASLNETDKLTYTDLSKWLNDLFEEVDGSNLVSSLLMAQSSSRGTKRAADWFTLKIGTMLTSCLIRPNSVMNVVRAVLKEIDAVSSSVTLESDWKKCDLVAQIICQCPRQIKIEDYIKLVAPQLLQLYFDYDIRYARHFYRVAGSIYATFAQRWPDLTRTHLTNKIIEFFTSSSTISAKDLMLNLTRLHLVYVASTEPNWFTLAQLPIEIIHLVFQIYSFVKTRVNAQDTKMKCEDLLRVYIRMMPSESKFNFYTSLLKCELVGLDDSCRNCIQFKQFNFGSFDEDESLELILIESKPSQDMVTIQMVESRCKLLAELIQNDETQIQFMLYLFDEIKQLIEKPLNTNSTNLKTQNDQSLLDIENKFTKLSATINLKIVYFTQIAYLIESIDPQQMIENHVKIIQFCYIILNKTIPIIKEDETNTESDEMIQLIFSIISMFTSGIIEVKHQVKQELQCLLPLLNELKLITNPESDLAKMAENLSISISTYCGVTFSKPSTKTSKPLIEEIDSNEDEYTKAIRDLNDPLVPVRAHGLVALRKLIDKKDSKALENKSKLLDHFLSSVKFNDSYVYLAAINGLIAMAMYEPTATLDILLSEYKTSKKLDVETQLKVGEALTKTVKNFNDLLPKYGPKLIDAFLVGCKHDDEFIRSSSLSNLGETCKLLNYSLSQNIHEIINCLSSLIEFDKSLQVKRSAIMVVKMVIEGLKQENFLEVLGSSALPLYKVLSKTKQICHDEIVQLNCQLTTDYLNDLMKNYLFPKQKLEKEIKILSI